MEKLLLELVFCSAAMSVISVIYIGLSRVFMNVWSAKTRSFLWAVILAGFMTPFKPSFGEPVYSVSLNSTGIPAAVAGTLPRSSAAHGGAVNISFIFAAVWLSGIIFFLVKYALKQKSFSDYVKRHAVSPSRQVLDIAAEAAEELKIKKGFSVVVLQEAVTPMMTGFKNPTVILPCKTYTYSQLRLIIKHELCHFKRNDLLYKLFIIVCRTVHWFNPFMGFLVRHIEQECELACDEAVVANESMENRKIYCNSVLDTVKAQSDAAKKLIPAVSSNFGDGRCDLKNRLKMIISEKRRKKLFVVSAVLVLLTALSGTVFAVTVETEYNSEDKLYEKTTFAHEYEKQKEDDRNPAAVNTVQAQEPQADGNFYDYTTTAVYDGGNMYLAETTTAAVYETTVFTSRPYDPLNDGG